MADNHLEFLRAVPGTAAALNPVPPAPERRERSTADPVATLRVDLEKQLEFIERQRAIVLEALREDHRHFRELEAGASALVDALAELERHRLEHRESSHGA